MLHQLEQNGAGIDCYIDLVNDYMAFWKTKNKLIEDITNRGVVYKDFSSVGIEMQKNNPSVKELVMVNRQMLAVLEKLGLDPAGTPASDEDAEM
jgi:hypothetical protein